jgi:hypothetical protein
LLRSDTSLLSAERSKSNAGLDFPNEIRRTKRASGQTRSVACVAFFCRKILPSGRL